MQYSNIYNDKIQRAHNLFNRIKSDNAIKLTSLNASITNFQMTNTKPSIPVSVNSNSKLSPDKIFIIPKTLSTFKKKPETLQNYQTISLKPSKFL